MLNIALPNGTLEARTTQFFKDARIALCRTPRCYRAKANDWRISRATFMRPNIIPMLVARGLYDLGVVGSDVVEEMYCDVTVLTKLDFSARGENREFRVVLVGHQDDPVKSIADIRDCTILSEFPEITKRAWLGMGDNIDIQLSWGATEAHIPHDFKYGVCIESTGETLRANNLRVIQILSTETTVIIGGPSRFYNKEKELAAISLLGDLTSCKITNL